MERGNCPGFYGTQASYSFSTLTDKIYSLLFLVTQILVLDPANRIVKLGAVLPGQVVKKTVSIVNNSLAQLTFNQSVLFSIPELQEAKVSVAKWGRGGGGCPMGVAGYRKIGCERPARARNRESTSPGTPCCPPSHARRENSLFPFLHKSKLNSSFPVDHGP